MNSSRVSKSEVKFGKKVANNPRRASKCKNVKATVTKNPKLALAPTCALIKVATTGQVIKKKVEDYN